MPSGAAVGLEGNMKTLFAAIDRAIELFVAAIFAAMVLIGSWQVFARFVLNATPSWSEEVQIFGHIWLVFLAIPIADRRGAHITVEAIRRVLSPWLNRALDLLIELLWVGFAVATAYYSYRVSLVTRNSVSPGLEIPMSYPYYGIILGSATSDPQYRILWVLPLPADDIFKYVLRRGVLGSMWLLPEFLVLYGLISGWWTAEIGRQPWIVWNELRTADAVSPTLSGTQVVLSLLMFALLYALLFALFIFLLNKHIQEGPPELEEQEPPETLPNTLREIFARKPRASAAGESDVAG